MNRLLREIGPADLESVSAIHRRLDDRLRRMRETVEELTERLRGLEAWVDLPDPPQDLAGTPFPWTVERERLLSEREALRRSLEEEKRASVLLREAGRVLASFLDLATAGLEEETLSLGDDGPASPLEPPTVPNAESNGAAASSPEPGLAVEVAPPALEWRSLARECLEAKGPLHYREIYRHLRSRSVVFGGAHPAGTFLATLNRDNGFVRVGRGVYWLANRPLPAPAAEAPDSPSVTSGGRR